MILSVFFNKNKLYIKYIIHTKFWKNITKKRLLKLVPFRINLAKLHDNSLYRAKDKWCS